MKLTIVMSNRGKTVISYTLYINNIFCIRVDLSNSKTLSQSTTIASCLCIPTLLGLILLLLWRNKVLPLLVLLLRTLRSLTQVLLIIWQVPQVYSLTLSNLVVSPMLHWQMAQPLQFLVWALPILVLIFLSNLSYIFLIFLLTFCQLVSLLKFWIVLLFFYPLIVSFRISRQGRLLVKGMKPVDFITWIDVVLPI